MQQYKYIKGSAADFVGAPDWAMVAVTLNSPYEESVDFAGKYSDGARIYYTDKRKEGNIGSKHNWSLIAHREPITEWNGDGLPPVGAKVEFYKSICYDYSNVGFLPETGDVVEVVAHKTTTDGNPVAVVFWDDKGAGRSNCFVGGSLAPLRTEAERKREEATKAMNVAWRARAGEEDDGKLKSIYEIIYDAVAAGKIPGIKLES